MKIVLGTANQNKINEFSKILGSSYQIEAGSSKADIVEDGTTCAANAVKKAYGYAEFVKDESVLVIGEDSGIFVPGLGQNVPGVWSSRLWACRYNHESKDLVLDNTLQEPEDFNTVNNQILIDLMNKYSSDDRSAYFYCSIAVVLAGGKFLNLVEGRAEGEVSLEIKDKNGWGYDQVFIGETGHWGEIPEDEKNKVSHRYAAILNFKNWLNGYKV